MNQELTTIISFYGLLPDRFTIRSFGSGLIHKTFIVQDIEGEARYILQEINPTVFRQPEEIAWNLNQLKSFLDEQKANYFLPLPIHASDGKSIVRHDGRFFRLTPYVTGSHTVDVCTCTRQAEEAANQFGSFTAMLADFDPTILRSTIPGFHDLSQRWEQFITSLQEGNPLRIAASREEIDFMFTRRDIVETFESIRKDPAFKIRVTHHDTKISNVLLDDQDNGICVIDLDTVMPGYFISDLGDMFRTYLSPVDESSRDLSKIIVRSDFRDAIVRGYLKKMRTELTEKEVNNLAFAGEFMIYMQALRFLTDHLNDDCYYGAAYNGQNYDRACNQIRLLQVFAQAGPIS